MKRAAFILIVLLSWFALAIMNCHDRPTREVKTKVRT